MHALARWVCGWPRATVGLWLAVVVLAAALARGVDERLLTEPQSFLPENQPYPIAVDLERRAFPELSARSRTVVIFERCGQLNETDWRHVAAVAQGLQANPPDDGAWRVQSPTTHPFLRSRLVSDDNKAAMIVVNSDANYVTKRSQLQVESIERIARANAPAGLTIEITGEGGMGRDLNVAGERALRRTPWVTVSAVLLILLVVYRAPLAALVPLTTIGLTVFLTMRVLDLLALAGWSVGPLEKTFAVVLIFGSGTDFAMFWIARYREMLGREPDRTRAATSATLAVAPAIITSAGATIAGLSMLVMAEFIPSNHSGRVLALALAISLVAALTLIPAVTQVMERALFWPTGLLDVESPTSQRWWRAVARRVVQRPAAMVLLSLGLLAGPTYFGTRIEFRYDGLGVTPPGSSSARGQAIAERHFSVAQLFSWSCLIETPQPIADPDREIEAAHRIAAAMTRIPGVVDVWSLADPLGRTRRGAADTFLRSLGRSAARPYYVSMNPPCMHFEVMLDAGPFSRRAMAVCENALTAAAEAAKAVMGPSSVVRAAGFTPYIINIKSLTDADQRRVTAYVVGVILIILLVWTRRALLAVLMLATTLAVYFATLGVTQWLFDTVLGVGGVDWKVRLILFVILVAVGQDYNIFLVSRLLQERRDHSAAEATWRAIVRTGSVISSCGVIMAATLGSLAAAGLPLYQQLGFAFAFGVLLDTFLIRPVLVPGLYLVMNLGRPK